jgi:hypothetical protein
MWRANFWELSERVRVVRKSRSARRVPVKGVAVIKTWENVAATVSGA